MSLYSVGTLGLAMQQENGIEHIIYYMEGEGYLVEKTWEYVVDPKPSMLNKLPDNYTFIEEVDGHKIYKKHNSEGVGFTFNLTRSGEFKYQNGLGYQTTKKVTGMYHTHPVNAGLNETDLEVRDFYRIKIFAVFCPPLILRWDLEKWNTNLPGFTIEADKIK